MHRSFPLPLLRRAAPLLVLFACWAAPVAAFEIGLPLACDYGRDCFIQNYFDHDPGPGFADYACGSLGYDGHTGTDFRITQGMLERGEPVVAVADGVVRAVRDGMDDVNVNSVGRAAVVDRKAGNAVLVEHGEGWFTQYSHLKKDSLLVAPGDVVVKGQRLGLVGLSGMTEFPHLELMVRHAKRAVDPFVGPDDATGCASARAPLWDEAGRAVLRYIPGGILGRGFAQDRAGLAGVRTGFSDTPPPRADAPFLFFWATAFGVRSGDVETMILTGPHGEVLAKRSKTVPRHQAQRMLYVGKRRPGSAWPSGAYRGEYTLARRVDGRFKVLARTGAEFVFP